MNDILTLRKHLHQNPELSGFEFETAKTIASFLKNYKPDELLENLGNGTGVIAIYHPEKEVKQTIMFRCELDALPIQEINDFEHQSVTDEVSHKCGHDGHMSVMCALAKKLSLQKMKHTKVILLFQPAEENGEGAVAIYNDTRFKELNPDKVFALHNLPGYDHHDIVVKNHTFTCAVNSIIIKLHGKTAHAGEPENGDNPALAIAEIINEFNKKIQPDPKKEKFSVLTPIFLTMGTEDYGISAGYGEVHYTFRRAANSEMKELEQELESIAINAADKYNLKPEISWTQRFSANENDPEVVDFVRLAAKDCQFHLIERDVPLQWGEDFGIFTEHYKGAMFGLGSGKNTPNLHNPDYDWPDEITETGAEIFYKISELIDAQ
ncbi:amidohydrolase [Chryseobacterium sp. SNU WT5]|uniref:amidohydrolase n=1 Tax=Chryseobacterium sp. SNU WT5 TaxID=2594269 RepID=UPI00117D24C2|nr:amidohydrolase [Chryseobacterium sp. SNU WT5]QDP84160.1 amidohydrolase [Chryseobacterium sp. SNU WT5]